MFTSILEYIHLHAYTVRNRMEKWKFCARKSNQRRIVVGFSFPILCNMKFIELYYFADRIQRNIYIFIRYGFFFIGFAPEKKKATNSHSTCLQILIVTLVTLILGHAPYFQFGYYYRDDGKLKGLLQNAGNTNWIFAHDRLVISINLSNGWYRNADKREP